MNCIFSEEGKIPRSVKPALVLDPTDSSKILIFHSFFSFFLFGLVHYCWDGFIVLMVGEVPSTLIFLSYYNFQMTLASGELLIPPPPQQLVFL